MNNAHSSPVTWHSSPSSSEEVKRHQAISSASSLRPELISASVLELLQTWPSVSVSRYKSWERLLTNLHSAKKKRILKMKKLLIRMSSTSTMRSSTLWRGCIHNGCPHQG